MIDYFRHLPVRVGLSIAIVLAWAVAFFGAPVWVPLAIAVDVFQDAARMRWLRLYGFALGLLTNELAGFAGLFIFWVASGFGLAMRRDRFQRLNGALQGWWAGNIMTMVCFFMDTKLVVTGAEDLLPSPVLVLSRHISFLDAAIPAVLLTSTEPNIARHVFMRELRFDPCIEICARRSPNYLVDRKGGEKERAAIERLGTTLGPNRSGVIFPEGGFRTEKRFERAVRSLRGRFPSLGEQAASFRYVMPPRPGGTYAFLRGAPQICDVALIAHAGFESVSSLADIISGCPIGMPVLVEVRRIARDDVPEDEAAFANWLFAQYRWIDEFAARYDQTVRSGRTGLPIRDEA